MIEEIIVMAGLFGIVALSAWLIGLIRAIYQDTKSIKEKLIAIETMLNKEKQ